MKKGWTTTKLIAAGSLGALTVVLQLLGSGINAVSGMPGLGGVTSFFLVAAMLMICLLVIDQFGAATIMLTAVGVLQIPLPLTGTPGFLPKLPIQIMGGIIADALYFPLKRNKRIASLAIGAVKTLYAMVSLLVVGRWFGMPGIEQTAKLLYSHLAIGALVVGAIGGYLGYIIYGKLKSTAVVKRIQS